MNKDIIIVDHINLIGSTSVNTNTAINFHMLEMLNLRVKNMRKWRSRIEKRKEKIKRLYE